MDFKERTLTGIKSLIAELKQMIVNGVTPAKTVSWFYRNTAPAGWAICDGRTVTMNDGSSLVTPNLIGRYPLGATSSIGGLVEAGLPNITGHIVAGGFAAGGAFSIISTGGSLAFRSGSNYWNAQTFNFNASQSSSVYGKSSTVTPPSVKLLPCIKL